MAGRTAALAFENFRAPLQRAISCVTDAIWLNTGYRPNEEHLLALSIDPVLLKSTTPLYLRAAQRYLLVKNRERGPWKVSTTEYIYALETDGEAEIVAYHWHPRSRVQYPHLHIPGPGYDDKHLPTGRIALEDVLRLLIKEYRVRPSRDDWSEILDESQSAFEAYRTWHGTGPRPRQ